MNTEVFHDSPWGYFQVMFAHPLSTTVIDVETGEARHYTDGDEA